MGASGEYQGQRFDIVGRIRLQLRNDYKNFWCAALHDGTRLWLMESFASFAMLSGVWREYASSGSDVRAGKVINAGKGLKFTGEFVEKCESLSYEGEIGGWDLFDRYFFVVQAANKENGIALFTLVGKKNIRFLSGEKVGVEMLGLKNIVVWDEWK